MNKWFILFAIIFLIIRAECQEPETTPIPTTSSTRKHKNELFKEDSTTTTSGITEINTTLHSVAVVSSEIDNSTTSTSELAGDATEAVELLQTHDADLTTGRDEWTTLPTTQNEYMISIKDVFEKSMDVVKDEIKGIGIIQDWLKEKAVEALDGEDSTTPSLDYEYTVGTEDYTENENDKETETDENEETITTTTSNPPINSNKFKDENDAIEEIENDLGKLQKIDDQQNKENKERDELVRDIEDSLNQLELKASPDLNTTTEVTTSYSGSAADANSENDTENSGKEITESVNVVEFNSNGNVQITEEEPDDKVIFPDSDNDSVIIEQGTESTQIIFEEEPESITEEQTDSGKLNIAENKNSEDVKVKNELEETSETVVNTKETEKAIDFGELDNSETEPNTEIGETITIATPKQVTEEDTIRIEDISSNSTDSETNQNQTVEETTVEFLTNAETTTEPVKIETENPPEISTVSDAQNEKGTETEVDMDIIDERTNDTQTETFTASTQTVTEIIDMNSAVTESTVELEQVTEVKLDSEIKSQTESEEKTSSTTLTTSSVTISMTSKSVDDQITKEPSTTQGTTEIIVTEENIVTVATPSKADELIDEIIEIIKEVEAPMTTTTQTTSTTNILIENTINLKKSVDKLLQKEDKLLDIFGTNAINRDDNHSDDDIFRDSDDNDNKDLLENVNDFEKQEEVDEEKEEEAFEQLELEIMRNENGQPLDKDTLIKSIEEEFLAPTSEQSEDEEETEHEDEETHPKIGSGYPASTEQSVSVNTQTYNKVDVVEVDADQYADVEDEEEVPVHEVSKTESKPKVSAVIREDVSGNVCLNASGLSIKIITNNITHWVPSTAFYMGECTSFGAYLNFTWRLEKGLERNQSLSFTIIGDEKESYIEEVILKLKQGAFVASQIEVYLNEPTVIEISDNVQLIISHPAIKLYKNSEKHDYATTPMLNVENALALQIASGGLCLFIVLIGVGIFTYKKLRSQARIFKVSLEK